MPVQLLMLLLVMGLKRKRELRGRGGSAHGGGRREGGMSAAAAIGLCGNLLEGTHDLCCFHVSSVLGSAHPSPIPTSTCTGGHGGGRRVGGDIPVGNNSSSSSAS